MFFVNTPNFGKVEHVFTCYPCESETFLPQIVLLEMHNFAESKGAILKILGKFFFRILRSRFFPPFAALFQIMLFNLLSTNALFKFSLLALMVVTYPCSHAGSALRPPRFLLSEGVSPQNLLEPSFVMDVPDAPTKDAPACSRAGVGRVCSFNGTPPPPHRMLETLY